MDSTEMEGPPLKQPQNAWAAPGPAAFDFRSDVVTTPTASMLTAIANTTLLDDVFREDPTTLALERHMAHLTGHAAGLFVLSGTMGNQLALRAHLLQPPHSILCDARSHILNWEAGGAASLSGALTCAVTPANGRYLTLEDVRAAMVQGDDVHLAPTRVVCLENTLGGAVMPLAETRRISEYVRACGDGGVKLHLDGARLWEAVAAGAGGLDEFAQLCDSVSLCFSKGLGAPVGSVLVGDEAFVRRARWIRKSIGGGLRQAGVLTAAARVAIEETFGTGPRGQGGKLRAAHEVAQRIAGMWTAMGGRLGRPTETNVVWLDLAHVGVGEDELVELGRRRGVKLLGARVVVHYQISEEAVRQLREVMADVMALKRERERGGGGGGGTAGVEEVSGLKESPPATTGQKTYGT